METSSRAAATPGLLDGQCAVVTGGSRGIGRAIAHAFAAAGADVVIASRKVEACRVVAAEIQSATGRRAAAVACHVGRWDECDQLHEEVYSQFGRCDVLVNNAGMSPLYPDLLSVSEDYYDKVSAVNLKGPFRLGALFGTSMAAGSGGAIINVSTVGSLRPGAHELVYACAKAGLNALTIGLADAFGPKVRVHAILPGAVLTDIADGWPDEYKSAAASNPLARAGVPEDFVGAAMFFATSASAWITGSLLRVDGGLCRQTS